MLLFLCKYCEAVLYNYPQVWRQIAKNIYKVFYDCYKKGVGGIIALHVHAEIFMACIRVLINQEIERC